MSNSLVHALKGVASQDVFAVASAAALKTCAQSTTTTDDDDRRRQTLTGELRALIDDAVKAHDNKPKTTSAAVTTLCVVAFEEFPKERLARSAAIQQISLCADAVWRHLMLTADFLRASAHKLALVDCARPQVRALPYIERKKLAKSEEPLVDVAFTAWSAAEKKYRAAFESDVWKRCQRLSEIAGEMNADESALAASAVRERLRAERIGTLEREVQTAREASAELKALSDAVSQWRSCVRCAATAAAAMTTTTAAATTISPDWLLVRDTHSSVCDVLAVAMGTVSGRQSAATTALSELVSARKAENLETKQTQHSASKEEFVRELTSIVDALVALRAEMDTVLAPLIVDLGLYEQRCAAVTKRLAWLKRGMKQYDIHIAESIGRAEEVEDKGKLAIGACRKTLALLMTAGCKQLNDANLATALFPLLRD